MEIPAHAPARSRVIWPGLLACGMVAACFFAQAWRGLGLWDESFYWYGAQRVLQGEVPIRDFMSYDPGRYYWAAAFMTVWGGHGIVALRAAEAGAQMLGLFAGCWLVARSVSPIRRSAWLVLAAVTLLTWMTPGFKACDFAVSIGLVAALAHLAERPDVRRHFIAGAAVGLAAVFGRNHGVYGLAGSILAMALLSGRREPGCTWLRALGAWAGGIVVGYLPVLILLIGCPGFARPFWDGVRFLLATGQFNIPLPVRWPWLVRLGPLGWGTWVQDFCSGLFYVGLLAFGVGGALWAGRRAWRGRPIAPGLLAAIALSLPYAHYAFARADAEHMALGIFPALLGGLIWLAARPTATRWIGGALLATASLAITVPKQWGWKSWRFHWTDKVAICGDTILVSPSLAREIGFLRVLRGRYAPDGGTFLATPFWPGAYAVMEVRAPVWTIYALLPSSEEAQRAEIRRIEATPPAFVVLQDIPLDGREELRFRNMHPLLNRYLHEHFEPVMDLDVPQPVTDLSAPSRLEVLIPRPTTAVRSGAPGARP